MQSLRYYQTECLDKMNSSQNKYNICNLFCGTGKTNIFTTYLENKTYKNTSIIAFPRIALLQQYKA